MQAFLAVGVREALLVCALALARLRLIAAYALNVLPVVRVWVSGGLRTVAFVVREMQRHVRSTVYVEEARRCRREWVSNTRVLEINTSLRRPAQAPGRRV